MEAIFRRVGNKLHYTPGSAVSAGDVVVVGSIPLVAERDIAASVQGDLTAEGIFEVLKDSSTFSAGDAVYWNETGTPVGGAATGAATSTASGAYLMGLAEADAATGATTVWVKMTAAKRTTTIAGSCTADDLTGSDASLGIAGKAGSSGAGGAIAIAGGAGDGAAGGAITVTGGTGGAASAGGAVSMVGGAPASGNAAGGAAALTGGAGSGTGNGGAVTATGGASGAGATGNGGAMTIAGGAAASTNGTGGAASLTGGAATGTGTGGALTLRSGASAGAGGTAGAVVLDAGAATGGTAGAVTIGATNAASVTIGKASVALIAAGPQTRGIGASTAAAGSTTADAGALPAGTASVYPTTAADDTKGVVIDAADKVTGRTLFIGNGVSNKILKVYPPSGGTINGASADAAFSSVSGKGVIIVCLSSSSNTWLAW